MRKRIDFFMLKSLVKSQKSIGLIAFPSKPKLSIERDIVSDISF